MLMPTKISSNKALSLENAITIKGLNVAYNKNQPILQNLNMEIKRANITILTAANGSGKTTLFRSILGLMNYSGEIKILEKPPRLGCGFIGYVPQRSQANWQMPISALDVVTSGLYSRIGRFVKASHRLEATEYLAMLKLDHKANEPVGNLSGGERQRVMLARALASRPTIYLLDEPFNNIDRATERILLDTFVELRNNGDTIFCIDHFPQRMNDIAHVVLGL